MPTVQDIEIKKPTPEEKQKCQSWPTWQSQPSIFDWAYTETEICLIIEGKVTISDSTGSVSFGPGDMVTFPQGLECTWKIEKPVKKHYNFN